MKRQTSKIVLAPENDFSKTLDTNDINSQFKDYALLEQKCVDLAQIINQLKYELTNKEEEISHLKGLLESLFPSSNDIVLQLSDEELIADIQLRKIREAAKNRDLTLDEIKKFDLLVKNKRLAKGDATVIETKKNQFDHLNKKEIIQIASQKIIKKDETNES